MSAESNNSTWLILIFAVAVMILFYVIDISSDVKQQSLTDAEKATQHEQQAQAKRERIAAAERHSMENEKLKALLFSDVPDNSKMTWVKLQLDAKHPFAFLLLITFFVLIAAGVVAKLLRKK